MSTRRETQGHTLSLAGAATLIVSLWLPWYSFRIPPAAFNYVDQIANQLGALGPLIRRGAQLVNQLGPLHVTAWQAFTATPAVLLVVGVVAGGLSLLVLTERAVETARMMVLAAVVGVVLVGYRIAVPPGQGDFVHPAWGIYLALAATVTILVGGMVARSESAQPLSELEFPAVPRPDLTLPDAQLEVPASGPAVSGWSVAQTVPPPSA